ncbi:MAG: TetR/AcrR family transcriptional regulator [Clostridia bacterium]|nr:TetR/AcrR family transcriptional regulator [Clostridia bacterium]
MPPKVKVTKQDIITTATALVRQNGESAINARSIAGALNCSTQPIFSNFATMDDLRAAVIAETQSLVRTYIERETASGVYPTSYKASGMAYIRFAKEEKELFKLLYMRTRKTDEYADDDALFNQMTDLVQTNTGLQGETTTLFHLEMWAFVHGIATMFATDFLDLEWELVSKMITDAYQGMKKQYGIED